MPGIESLLVAFVKALINHNTSPKRQPKRLPTRAELQKYIDHTHGGTDVWFEVAADYDERHGFSESTNAGPGNNA